MGYAECGEGPAFWCVRVALESGGHMKKFGYHRGPGNR